MFSRLIIPINTHMSGEYRGSLRLPPYAKLIENNGLELCAHAKWNSIETDERQRSRAQIGYVKEIACADASLGALSTSEGWKYV